MRMEPRAQSLLNSSMLGFVCPNICDFFFVFWIFSHALWWCRVTWVSCGRSTGIPAPGDTPRGKPKPPQAPVYPREQNPMVDPELSVFTVPRRSFGVSIPIPASAVSPLEFGHPNLGTVLCCPWHFIHCPGRASCLHLNPSPAGTQPSLPVTKITASFELIAFVEMQN